MWHQLPVRGNPEFHFHSVQHHSVTTVAQNCKNITNATKYMDINALWKYMNAINKAAQKLNPTIIIWYIDAFLEWKNTLYIDSTKKSICYGRCSLFRERVQLHKLVFFRKELRSPFNQVITLDLTVYDCLKNTLTVHHVVTLTLTFYPILLSIILRLIIIPSYIRYIHCTFS